MKKLLFSLIFINLTAISMELELELIKPAQKLIQRNEVSVEKNNSSLITTLRRFFLYSGFATCPSLVAGERYWSKRH